jgi:Fe-S oxidoreductase
MAVTPMLEVNEMIREMGGEDLNECMQCGLCSGVCPWGKVESPFLTRLLIRMGQLGIEGYETEDILFACTTCKLCVDNCPRNIKIIDIIEAMRSSIVEYGGLPGSLKAVVGSVHANGNPWSGTKEDREKWYSEAKVEKYDDSKEYFLYVCCTSCYDPRGVKIAKALVEIFNRAGVSYGVIGQEESCCGQAIKKAGALNEFEMLKESNVKLLKEKGVKKIIVTSPHCYVGFTEDYGEELGDIEIYHYVEILLELIKEGKIKVSNKLGKKVIYHDPCYMGRHAELYEEPREVLNNLLEEEGLIEFDENREFSLCCGAGGGRMWMETPPEQRFSDIKIREAGEKGAEILATCCPYCVNMFEDSVKTTGYSDKIEVKDISELVLELMDK